MTTTSALVSRWAVLALLVTLLAGPAGAAGLLHPFDDEGCASHEGETRLVGAPGGVGFAGGHCVTCHLLRGVGGGISTDTVLRNVPQPADLPLTGGPVAYRGRPGATISDRSPPFRR